MATFDDLREYLQHDGWDEEPNLSRGRARAGDHRRFRKELADGTILRTKVPHGPRADIGKALFRHILRDQLRVTEDRFWAVVRGAASEAEPLSATAETIPGWLVQRLLYTVGLPEDEVRSMTADEARAAWEGHRGRTRSGPHSGR